MPTRERVARARSAVVERPGRVPVELWLEDDSDALFLQRGANLSPTGAVFAHTEPRDLGARVRVRFTLPGDEVAVLCEGEIVSSQGEGGDWEVWVRFLDLPPDVRTRIARLTGGRA